MIERFKLNHKTLVFDREKEISGIFSDDFIDSMTVDDLQQIADAMEPPSKAPGTEFAFIIRSIALDLIP